MKCPVENCSHLVPPMNLFCEIHTHENNEKLRQFVIKVGEEVDKQIEEEFKMINTKICKAANCLAVIFEEKEFCSKHEEFKQSEEGDINKAPIYYSSTDGRDLYAHEITLVGKESWLVHVVLECIQYLYRTCDPAKRNVESDINKVIRICERIKKEFQE